MNKQTRKLILGLSMVVYGEFNMLKNVDSMTHSIAIILFITCGWWIATSAAFKDEK